MDMMDCDPPAAHRGEDGAAELEPMDWAPAPAPAPVKVLASQPS